MGRAIDPTLSRFPPPLARHPRPGYTYGHHVKKLWTSMHNSAYNCDFENLIAPLNSLGTLEIYHVIKTAN